MLVFFNLCIETSKGVTDPYSGGHWEDKGKLKLIIRRESSECHLASLPSLDV